MNIRAPIGGSRVIDGDVMCQQRDHHISLSWAGLLLAAAVTCAAACSHYTWGNAPPAPAPDESDSRSHPAGPVVSTVHAPPDWGLNGHTLANVTVRALHRHGAPRATRVSDDPLPRVSCRLLGNRPTGFSHHQLARVVAQCRWHPVGDRPAFEAIGIGSVSTTTRRPGNSQTSPLRRSALRTAARQALSRAAGGLLANWRQRRE